VQRKFTHNIICNPCKILFKSYADHLFKLGIKSLEYRRAEFNLMLMYKVYHNLSDLQFNDYFSFRHTYNLRHHCFTVQSLFNTKHEQYCHFFFIRFLNVWNHLPEEIVSTSSLTLKNSRPTYKSK